MISVPFVQDFSRGFRWNDPAVGIAWPKAPTVISERDANYPFLAELGLH
jgi:dTDP-4-dehydrorhamnose 3,5-epimerase